MKNKKLKFDLDSKDIKLKKLLEGDFLRLEAYTISDAKPNRNGSHFTKESMKKAIPTFFDKPVLAYYNAKLGEDGDFMGHECPQGLQYDESVDALYYDYSSPASEIPIGTVRQSDTVELIEKDGLNWIKVTCVLWTKYNYKAVRSLLRSKKGKTKLSVEIEVLDSHDENGVEVIDEFCLDGFTLLGRDSRNREIEEGIAGAHAIAIDFLDENFAKHQKCLAFAYSALDNYNNNITVETPDEVKTLEQDSNIKFTTNETSIDNEEKPELRMEEDPQGIEEEPQNIEEKPQNIEEEEPQQEEVKKVNQEEGGIPAMQLTMHAKMELLRSALEKALCGEDPERCCYIWVMDICDKFVYYELGDDKFRCPYAINELGEEHEVLLNLDAQERVVPSWSVFSAEEKAEEHSEEFEAKTSEANFDHGEHDEHHDCPKNIIHALLIDEHEAVQGYNCAIKKLEKFPLIVKIMEDIAHEELEHIGELEQALTLIDPETEEEIEEGKEEAKETVIEALMEEHEEAEHKGGMEKVFSAEEPEKPEDSQEDDDMPEEEDMPEKGDSEENGTPEGTNDDKPVEDETPTEDGDDEPVENPEDDGEIADKEGDKEDDKEEEACQNMECQDMECENMECQDMECKNMEAEAGDAASAEHDGLKDCEAENDTTSAEHEGLKDCEAKECESEEEPEEEDSEEEDSEEEDSEEEQPEDEKEDFEANEEVKPNHEPLPVDVTDMPMSDIVAVTVQSIAAPEVVIDAEHVGEATDKADILLPNADSIVINPTQIPEEMKPFEPTPVDNTEQPDDEAKALEFEQKDEAKDSKVEANPEFSELLKKYNELEEKFNKLNEAAKTQEAERLFKFGEEFINADSVVDEESKQKFIAQVNEKCFAYEINSEEEVVKFAKGLMAMYYYEHQSVRNDSRNSRNENNFSISINKTAHADNKASNNKLKDAINKLNYLNKEE